MWESIRSELASRDPPIDEDATELGPILEAIEPCLAEYIPPTGVGHSTRLFVSRSCRRSRRWPAVHHLGRRQSESNTVGRIDSQHF